jgi:hypothetical protein
MSVLAQRRQTAADVPVTRGSGTVSRLSMLLCYVREITTHPCKKKQRLKRMVELPEL